MNSLRAVRGKAAREWLRRGTTYTSGFRRSRNKFFNKFGDGGVEIPARGRING